MPNIAPQVDLNGAAAGNNTSLGYTEGDPPAAIAPAATATDPDSPDLDQGSLTIAFTAGGTSDDQLRVTSGDFTVDEADLYYQGLLIGTIAGGTDGSTPLVVTFNADATPAIAQALIRAIAYVNFSQSPVPGDRTVTFTLSDGDGGTATPRVATVTVAAVDTPPVANDDSITTDENAVATGSVFADNGNGNDSDPDGPALSVAAVNGSPANVGATITLASGAKLTVNADGTYSYDPNGQFNSLAGPDSGAVNTSAVDTFTYTLTGGNTATATVTVNGVAGPGDRLMGDSNDNAITGTPNADLFVVGQGGNDMVTGLGGDDVFYFGGALTPADKVDGGEGRDTIVLQGNYAGGLTLGANVSGIEAISMLAGSNTSFGEPGTNRYDYVLTTSDSNFDAGARVKINGANLLAGEDLTFNGASETDASFIVYGGRGTDTLTGGLGNDIFFFADAGQFAAGDTINGGAGYDSVYFRGNYTIDFNARGYAGALTGIESITLSSAADTRYARGGGSEFDYDVRLADGLAGAGATLTVNGTLLQANETMKLDGSLETDGLLRIFAGAADDTLIGGAQADLIHGNFGADTLTGGGGADTFRYQKQGESTATSLDHILDFAPGTDKIELTRMDADTNADGNQAFHWIGSDAFTGSAGELRAYENNGTWFVEGDTNGDGTGDFLISLTLQGQTPLGEGDFFL